jgi:hypothetical protein
MAMTVGMLAHEASLAGRVRERCVPAKVRMKWVKNRDEHVAARAQDAGELEDGGVEIHEMRQRGPADDDVELLGRSPEWREGRRG